MSGSMQEEVESIATSACERQDRVLLLDLQHLEKLPVSYPSCVNVADAGTCWCGVQTRLNVWAWVLPGCGVEESGREHGRRLHLVLCQHCRNLRNTAYPDIVWCPQEGDIRDGTLQPNQ